MFRFEETLGGNPHRALLQDAFNVMTQRLGHVSKVVEQFGFKLQLLIDVKHEVALAYEVTDTKAGDGGLSYFGFLCVTSGRPQ